MFLKKLFKTIVRFLQTILVLIFILFEELIWEQLARPIYEYIHGLKILQRVEVAVERSNRYFILLLFVILLGSVELAGIAAGILLIQGFFFIGVGLYLFKIPIAAFTFWLFRISKNKLLSFAWFAWSYEKTVAGFEWVKSREIYIETVERVKNIKKSIILKTAMLKKFFKERKGTFWVETKSIYQKLKKYFHS